jgi:hypothetical protein
MKHCLFLPAIGFLALAPGAAGRNLDMPEFPMPSFVRDDLGGMKEIGFLKFFRELQKGGVQGLDEVEFLDTGYAVLKSDSLPTLAAWLEAACSSVGLELPLARSGNYDGTVLARLLEVATTLAVVRERGKSLAMPIGLLICRRREKWGDLPGDGKRDAYVLIETDKGLLVYDPPTRQLVALSNFSNTADIVTIQF